MTDDVLARLRALQAGDLPVHGGRTLAYVYDSGPARGRPDRPGGGGGVRRLQRPRPDRVPEPAARWRTTWSASPATCSTRPTGAVGTVTSGGTESCCSPCRRARDARPTVGEPDDGAADDRARGVPQGRALLRRRGGAWCRSAPTSAPTSRRWTAAIDERRRCWSSAPRRRTRTASSTRSPRSRPLAAARGIRCHVDACIGGWVLPYAARLGRPVPPWTFAVDGVTSISVDLHKYAYAPKGTSLLLHRTPELRRPQFFASADWPGYTMLNSTMQSTKSGGPLAGAWAVVQSLGDDGLPARWRDEVFEAVDRIVAGRRRRCRAVDVVVPPDSTLVALVDRRLLRRVHDLRRDGGARLVRPAADVVRRRAADASTCRSSAATLRPRRRVPGRAARRRWRRRGPPARSRSTPSVVAFIEALDPAALTDDDFDGLLAASGLVGDRRRRRARPPRPGWPTVNAMLDVASPAMREALLIAFLDRLSRPVR